MLSGTLFLLLSLCNRPPSGDLAPRLLVSQGPSWLSGLGTRACFEVQVLTQKEAIAEKVLGAIQAKMRAVLGGQAQG